MPQLTGPELEADTIVGLFRQCVWRGDEIDQDAPRLLKGILANGWWRRPNKKGELFTRLEDFIVAKPLPGLGSDVATVRRVIEHDPVVLDLYDQATGNHQGMRTDIVDNVNDVGSRPDGNSRQRALRALRKHRKDLHTRVLAGELSPHRAMVEAGLRKKQITIPGDPVKAARRLAGHFTGELLARLIKELETFR